MKTAKPVSNSTQPASTSPFISKENGESNSAQERQPFFPGSSKDSVQCKLSVGKANDSYEKEADRVADHVVQNISSTKSENSNTGSIQKKSAPSITPLVQRKCAECEKEEKLQKKEEVDEEKLEQAKSYQKNNFDVKTNKVATEDGAGVMLYSLSSTARSSAKEAREAKDFAAKAKSEGKISNDEPTVENLVKSGLSKSEALRYGTAYEINRAAKQQAQQDDVMEGFGSNGGEEFLSYLQTGEGLIMSRDHDWKKWYSNISGRLVKIQNDDGSWNGHHCITSPVFCTATALLILSVNNDVQQLMAKK